MLCGLVVYECGVGDLAAMAALVPRLSTVSRYCERWPQMLLSSQPFVDRSVCWSSQTVFVIAAVFVQIL